MNKRKLCPAFLALTLLLGGCAVRDETAMAEGGENIVIEIPVIGERLFLNGLFGV